MKTNITNDEARFLRLFASNALTFVKRTKVAAVGRTDGKHEANYFTVEGAIGVADVRRHFAGEVSLVAKPVQLDKRCCWAAIDIDLYDAEAFGEIERAAAELPLHIFRSKSGGAHLFAFFDPPQFAAEVRGQLADWAAQLGHPGAEIFPAQNQIDAGNLGLGIALPFFGDAARFAKFTPRTHSLNGTAPKEPVNDTQPMGIPIPLGVSFRDVLATKLNFKTVTRNGGIAYQYHGITGLDGKPQACLVQESVHQSHAGYAGESAFIEQNGRFFHTCFDSDCRLKSGIVRGPEAIDTGDTISVTRLVIQKLGLSPFLLPAASGLLPVVVVHAGEIPEAVDQGEDILLNSAEKIGIFQRGTDLVRVIRLQEIRKDRVLKRPQGTVMLETLAVPTLMEIFERHVQFEKLKKNKNGKVEVVRINCPLRVATSYLARTGAWKLPVLTGVITAPVLRDDGTVLRTPGYDEQTGLYLVSDEAWPEISDRPTKENAEEALKELLKPFTEFPFVQEEDNTESCKAVFVAAILTAIQRRLLGPCPIFGFSAPAQRSGKSLLAESVAEIATGKPAPATSVSKVPEELRKAVTSILREGHAIANLDNIIHPLGSPFLAAAVTQGEYGDRLLGENKNLNLPTNVTWTATGNNLSFRSDLTSRALLCRIDPSSEKPEEREFKIPDLPAHLHENRVRLVTAALTILKAFHVAGKPVAPSLKPWGGFTHWSDNVRAAVVWAGCDDPCRTREAITSDDEDLELAAQALVELQRVMKCGSFTTHEVVQLATVRHDTAEGIGALYNKELNAALSAVALRKEKIDPRSLSWFFRHWKDRFIGGMRLRCASRKDASQSRWRIEGQPRIEPETPVPATTPGDATGQSDIETSDLDFTSDLPLSGEEE